MSLSSSTAPQPTTCSASSLASLHCAVANIQPLEHERAINQHRRHASSPNPSALLVSVLADKVEDARETINNTHQDFDHPASSTTKHERVPPPDTPSKKRQTGENESKHLPPKSPELSRASSTSTGFAAKESNSTHTMVNTAPERPLPASPGPPHKTFVPGHRRKYSCGGCAQSLPANKTKGDCFNDKVYKGKSCVRCKGKACRPLIPEARSPTLRLQRELRKKKDHQNEGYMEFLRSQIRSILPPNRKDVPGIIEARVKAGDFKDLTDGTCPLRMRMSEWTSLTPTQKLTTRPMLPPFLVRVFPPPLVRPLCDQDWPLQALGTHCQERVQAGLSRDSRRMGTVLGNPRRMRSLAKTT